MKKMVVMAIAVLFLSVSLCYASSVPQPDMEGPISSLTLGITYEELQSATTTLQAGKELLTVTSGLNAVSNKVSVYEPQIYLDFTTLNFATSTPGLLSDILISWLGPNINDIDNEYYASGTRILTMACGGGNNSISNLKPDLPEGTDGTVSTKPQVSISKPPATKTFSIKGVAGCKVCPSGLQFSGKTLTGICNDGSSYVNGYITYTGTATKNISLGYVTSASFTFTVGAGGFYYSGEDWAVDLNPTSHLSGKDCNNYSATTPSYPLCPAILTGTLKGTLAPCATGSDYLNCIPE